MRRKRGAAPRLGGMLGAMLGVIMVAVLVSGCAKVDQAAQWNNRVTGNFYDSVGNAGTRLGVFWGGSRPTAPEEGLTIARVMGAPPSLEPLTPESGDVWPKQEAPRATLANPDAALRGIPNYRSGESPTYPNPLTTTPEPRRRGALPPGITGSSSPPPPPYRSPEERFEPRGAPPPMLDEPRPRRADGRVMMTPQGPVTTTGGTDRIQGTVTPGGGTGTAINDGNVTTLIGPDGQVQGVVRPR